MGRRTHRRPAGERGARLSQPMRGRGLHLAASLLVIACGGAACVGPLAPGSRSATPPSGPGGPCVPAGRWFDPATRQAIAPHELLARSARRRIVLLGERHDAPDHQRWQLQTLAALQALRPELVVGFEPFPRRVQPVLDRWVAGELNETAFLRETDWQRIWGYPPAQYLPLFHFARLNRLAMRALNVDRTLIAAVSRRGLAATSEAEREGVGLPVQATPEYRTLLGRVFELHAEGDAQADDGARERFLEAQLTWDRAMAEALAAAVAERPTALVVGLMGSGHLERRLGVPHQLAALGIRDVFVLLPWDTDRDCAELAPDLADAVFGIAPAARSDTDSSGSPRLGLVLAQDAERWRIAQVQPRSVAAAAGLRAGDIVVRAAGTPVRSPEDLRLTISRVSPGTWVPLEIERRGRLRTVIAKFPPAPSPSRSP